MKISVAQIKPIKGDISANILKHKKLIEFASSSLTTAIFFPELSLTGYEPALVNDLATNLEDSRFDIFQKISNTHTITIGVGVPVKLNAGIQISMIIFQPYSQRQTYSKQQLHFDELPYFVKGEMQLILTVDNKKIAPAICYESLQPDHSYTASKLGAEIYVTSVAKSQKGVNKAMIHYPGVAKKYSMPVLMSNSVGYCDNFLSVGNSSVWTKEGVLVGQLNDKTEGLLIFDTETEEVIRMII